jgi:hypothetical protein
MKGNAGMLGLNGAIECGRICLCIESFGMAIVGQSNPDVDIMLTLYTPQLLVYKIP